MPSGLQAKKGVDYQNFFCVTLKKQVAVIGLKLFNYPFRNLVSEMLLWVIVYFTMCHHRYNYPAKSITSTSIALLVEGNRLRQQIT